jgi:hypothetical protein
VSRWRQAVQGKTPFSPHSRTAPPSLCRSLPLPPWYTPCCGLWACCLGRTHAHRSHAWRSLPQEANGLQGAVNTRQALASQPAAHRGSGVGCLAGRRAASPCSCRSQAGTGGGRLLACSASWEALRAPSCLGFLAARLAAPLAACCSARVAEHPHCRAQFRCLNPLSGLR